MSLKLKRRAAWLAALAGALLVASQVMTMAPYLPVFWGGLLVAFVAMAWIVGEGE
jgi:hypothetical protein